MVDNLKRCNYFASSILFKLVRVKYVLCLYIIYYTCIWCTKNIVWRIKHEISYTRILPLRFITGISGLRIMHLKVQVHEMKFTLTNINQSVRKVTFFVGRNHFYNGWNQVNHVSKIYQRIISNKILISYWEYFVDKILL